MTERRYLIYDVFSNRRLEGNPLAIVLDSEGLDDDAMLAVAAEFNLSETVFVGPPQGAQHKAAIRIYTPKFELPFAGHPTVGTAIALSELGAGGETEILVLEERIGNVRCVVSRQDEVSFAEFDLPELSRPLDFDVEPAVIGAALGLDPQDIGFENHRPGLWSAGVGYLTVPVAGLEAAARAQLDARAWREIAPERRDGFPVSAYVYCRETVNHDSAFHARMFVPGPPTYEDPATGSAAAAFSGAVVAFDAPPDGPHVVWIEQGIEMGRPSRIRLEMEIAGGEAVSARIGGHAVKVAEGRLTID